MTVSTFLDKFALFTDPVNLNLPGVDYKQLAREMQRITDICIKDDEGNIYDVTDEDGRENFVSEGSMKPLFIINIKKRK